MFGFVASFALLVAFLVGCSAATPYKDENERKAVLLLDAITFPKIVPNPNRDVIVLVSQKNQLGDYGTDSVRSDFFSFAYKVQTQGDADHVIFAQVIVNGAENGKLSKDIGVGDDFVHPKMFIYPAGANTAIQYPDDQPFHLNTLTQFTRQHSSLQFQLPGTMKKFDDLATQFLSTDERTQKSLLIEAERALEDLTETAQVETATYYVKVMTKITENGIDYLKTEIKRLKKLMNDASRVTKAGRRKIENHLNVLNHFVASVPNRVKDEF